MKIAYHRIRITWIYWQKLKKRRKRSWGHWKLFGHFWSSLAGPFLSLNLWSIMACDIMEEEQSPHAGLTTKDPDLYHLHHPPPRPRPRIRGQYFVKDVWKKTISSRKTKRSMYFRLRLFNDVWSDSLSSQRSQKSNLPLTLLLPINLNKNYSKYSPVQGTGHNTITVRHGVTYTDSELNREKSCDY